MDWRLFDRTESIERLEVGAREEMVNRKVLLVAVESGGGGLEVFRGSRSESARMRRVFLVYCCDVMWTMGKVCF